MFSSHFFSLTDTPSVIPSLFSDIIFAFILGLSLSEGISNHTKVEFPLFHSYRSWWYWVRTNCTLTIPSLYFWGFLPFDKLDIEVLTANRNKRQIPLSLRVFTVYLSFTTVFSGCQCQRASIFRGLSVSMLSTTTQNCPRT